MDFRKQIGIFVGIVCYTSVVEGSPLLCVGTEPYDVGYLKNVIMELARKLHEILSLKTSTRLCHKLEKIRTSWFSVYNIKRSEVDNDKKFQLIEKAGLSMLDDFIKKVAKAVDRFPIEDQKSLADAIDTANKRLITSKMYKENEGSLIFEKLDELKRTFCPDSAPTFSQAELKELLAAQHSAHGPIPHDSGGNQKHSHEPLPESPFIKELPSEGAFETEVLRQTKPVLVNFHASWCKTCHIFAPRLCEVVIKNGGEVPLVRIDADEKNNLSANYGATSLPLTIGFKNGREVDRFVGFKEEKDVQEFIDKLKSS